MTDKKNEEFIIDGAEVVAKVKEIIKEGNARKIIIKDVDDKTLLEIPLTWAAVGAIFLPVLAAVGALAAIVTKCKIVVEKK